LIVKRLELIGNQTTQQIDMGCLSDIYLPNKIFKPKLNSM